MQPSPSPAEGAAQRCNPRSHITLRRQGRGERDRLLSSDAENGTGYWYVDRFGYALLGFTAASAAAAGLGLVLVSHPAGKSWCRQLAKNYLPRSWNGRLFHMRPGERESESNDSGNSDSEDNSESELSGLEGRGVQLSLETLGLNLLDLRAPPRNVKMWGVYSFRDEVRQTHFVRRKGETMHSENVPLSSGTSIVSIVVSDKGFGVGVNVDGGEKPVPEPRQFLLVEVPPHLRELTLRLYEALEEKRSPAAPSYTDESRGDRTSRRLAAWAGFTCPYHGLIRARAYTASSQRGGFAGQEQRHHSATISDEEEEAEEEDARLFLGQEERHHSVTSSDEGEDARLFLALADPREGMRSPCTLTVQIGGGDSAPKTRRSRRDGHRTTEQAAYSRFRFKGMCWEGASEDNTLTATPSAWEGILRLSLGEDWGRSLFPEEFGRVVSRFFHDGRRLHGEIVNCVLLKLRAIARLYYCRDVDISSNNNRQSSEHRFLPETILISYDSAAAAAGGDLSGVRGSADPRQNYRRPGEYDRDGSHVSRGSTPEDAWRGQEVDVRVVEVKRAHTGDVGARDGARKGLEQIIGLLERLLGLSHELSRGRHPNFATVDRFTSRLLSKPRNAVPGEDTHTATTRRLRAYQPREYAQEEWRGPLARSAWGETYGDLEAGSPTRDSVMSTNSRSGGESVTARGRRGDRDAPPRQQQLAKPAHRRRASWFTMSATPSAGGSGGNAPSRHARSVGEGVRTGRQERDGEPPSITPTGRSISRDRDNDDDDTLLGKQRARSLPSRSRNPFSSLFREGDAGRGESFDETFSRSSLRTWGDRWGGGCGSGDNRGSVDGSESCDFRDGRTDNGGSQRDSLEEEILDCISSTASHLPKRVQKTVDVDIHRRRYERGDESDTVQGHGTMAVLEGWKVAVEALDQSHRELRCYREVESEASSAILGALEATMATFRGQVLVMTGKNAEWLVCRAKRCQQSPEQAAKLFKEAHLAVKSVVVMIGGDGPPGARWRLSERQLTSVAGHHLNPLLENLRLLVVAFDNMREEDRMVNIATVEEIVNNRDWLLRIAIICTSAERRARSRHSRSAAAPSRTATPDVAAVCPTEEHTKPTTATFTAASPDDASEASSWGGSARFEGRSLDDARAHFDRVLERRDSLARSRGVAGGGVGQGNAIGGGSSRIHGRSSSGDHSRVKDPSPV